MPSSMQANNLGRLERKREKTRQSLVNAARTLVRRRGSGERLESNNLGEAPSEMDSRSIAVDTIEKISIQDITAQADVGLGTFYNYFESKQWVFEAVLDEIKDKFNLELANLREPLTDPATIIAVTLQYCFEQAQDNEEWRSVVRYSGLEGEYLLLQDESQCLEDIRTGTDGGRFKVDDIDFTTCLVQGMVKYVTREISQARLSRNAMAETTRCILRMLGIPDLVAKALTQNAADRLSARSPDIVRHKIGAQAAQKRGIPKQVLMASQGH